MRDALFIYKANPIEMDQPKNNTYLQATTEKNRFRVTSTSSKAAQRRNVRAKS